MSDQHNTTPPPRMYQAPGPDTRPTSGLAIASMVLGILSLCLGPLGLIALIMGIIGIVKTGARAEQKGQGFAIAGTALGAFGVLGTCFTVGIMLPALGKAREAAEQLLSESQINTLIISCENYARDNNGNYPSVASWEQDLEDYLGAPIDEITLSPAEDGDGVSYIYLGGSYPADPDHILFYEDPDHWPSVGVLVGFADSGVEMIPFDIFEQMLAEQLDEQESP